jgi:hypothetical protein
MVFCEKAFKINLDFQRDFSFYLLFGDFFFRMQVVGLFIVGRWGGGHVELAGKL